MTTTGGGQLVVVAVAVYFLALLVLAVPLTAKERGESGETDHGNPEWSQHRFCRPRAIGETKGP
ncbi:hypothetical protein [Natronobacterium gregoryi]|uniref:Uncharacterized protein n=2 Tax=Natronobacterium gregoryi TaxID=44930 RepID=L0AFN5_NATGS|nr:hypothetical protein [Natronobacterium gregoryi]AFZ71880.1 hypothetical protein Natgr_0632 [Natronobacterium gregoryi SP2]ELY73050.1 hypothetical protein C490_01869 [Natronobacterium gregoryi SP2]PLK19396.1 hypothetical protein CYV19_15240 [Natronobacterium gregoryi SP2]SFJ51160.1 hypothetical protein SAMN05443661_13535 [Natronobacterium gregoryi]